MKAAIVIWGLVLLCFCGCKNKEEKLTEGLATTSEMAEEDKLNAVTDINLLVDKIEAAKEKMQKVEMATNDLRSQIKQKWSKIHFYLDNGKIARIKTYPYEQISKRTEEFYFDKDQLTFVIIQDNGEEAKDDKEVASGKMYYFKDGKFIKEINNSGEEEHEIRSSDSERLQKEAEEYLLIFKNKK